MHCWIVQLRSEDVAAAMELRLVAGLEIAEAEGFVWIRGGELDDQTARLLRGLPMVACYDWWPDDQLVIRGRRVPSRRLPGATWVPLRDWFNVELPTCVWPGQFRDRIALRLVRSGQVQEASLLLTSVDQWLPFGTRAAEVRLESLHFAAIESGGILILGQPLPALRGTRLACTRGIAVPCGWRWEPAVDANVVADMLRLAEGDVALLIPQASSFSIDVVASEQFVRASRSAIRASAEAISHGS